jgi:hypothetical protein
MPVGHFLKKLPPGTFSERPGLTTFSLVARVINYLRRHCPVLGEVAINAPQAGFLRG